MDANREDTIKQIENLIASKKVFLFMKGTPDMPQCGFSAQVVYILRELGVDFASFDILSDQNIRQTLKEYSDWPTFPQLWVSKKLVGGCDIVSELAQSGELEKILAE